MKSDFYYETVNGDIKIWVKGHVVYEGSIRKAYDNFIYRTWIIKAVEI